jgi:hypothetical protein
LTVSVQFPLSLLDDIARVVDPKAFVTRPDGSWKYEAKKNERWRARIKAGEITSLVGRYL